MEEKIITADDVIRAGACVDGVLQRVANMNDNGNFAAAMSVRAIIQLIPKEEHTYVLEAAKLDGYGNGSGDGDGSGSGDGSGYGNGSGYGDGSDYGYNE